MFRIYRRHAKNRGLPFELSLEEFGAITQQRCFYCHKDPEQKYDRKWQNGAYIYNGIDRLDNQLGYTTANSVAACGRCNHAKAQLSVSEFLEMCRRVANVHPISRDEG